ncbi:hypothetical protein LY90DRAFT_506715 [Neocallimastix californiae]|uniref:RGS domain-containing protein n=1 Tax=Neocallimastix californiae TaxID=1754190 RepID=A0A1Y2DB26_9FUNG|nr:hypothetical protein LY90DRAFT_506715 [Neocallimastix californiae]|eukprot:ORY56468.1 hypothetical protein LY90DRAFT_506715 [Neocallimastix californiae]
MIEKRNLFNTTHVTKEEYKEYLHRGFISENDFLFEKILYQILFILFIIFALVSLILFFKLRKSYIIRQRGFTISFIGGIVNFISVIIEFLPQLMKVPCALSIYSTNLLNVVVNLIFFCRSLRIVLFYHYNFFKMMVIVIPTLISLIITVTLHLTIDSNTCSFIKLEDAMLDLKHNKSRRLFSVFQIFNGLSMIFSFILALLLAPIKDTNILGAKFECFTTCILILVVNFLHIFLQRRASDHALLDYSKNPRRMYLNLYEITKGGRMLFVVVSIYMLFASITLPVIYFYKAKKAHKKFIENDLTSKKLFNKVLNTPSLVHDLRSIALKEFSVENVLFWENYQDLQNMNYLNFIDYNKSEESREESGLLNQFYYEYMDEPKHKQFYSTSSMNNYDYNPYSLIAALNIHNEIDFPTIGIFDSAKDEIIEKMYYTIYPILLKKSGNIIKEILC